MPFAGMEYATGCTVAACRALGCCCMMTGRNAVDITAAGTTASTKTVHIPAGGTAGTKTAGIRPVPGVSWAGLSYEKVVPESG